LFPNRGCCNCDHSPTAQHYISVPFVLLFFFIQQHLERKPPICSVLPEAIVIPSQVLLHTLQCTRGAGTMLFTSLSLTSLRLHEAGTGITYNSDSPPTRLHSNALRTFSHTFRFLNFQKTTHTVHRALVQSTNLLLITTLIVLHNLELSPDLSSPHLSLYSTTSYNGIPQLRAKPFAGDVDGIASSQV